MRDEKPTVWRISAVSCRISSVSKDTEPVGPRNSWLPPAGTKEADLEVHSRDLVRITQASTSSAPDIPVLATRHTVGGLLSKPWSCRSWYYTWQRWMWTVKQKPQLTPSPKHCSPLLWRIEHRLVDLVKTYPLIIMELVKYKASWNIQYEEGNNRIRVKEKDNTWCNEQRLEGAL